MHCSHGPHELLVSFERLEIADAPKSPLTHNNFYEAACDHHNSKLKRELTEFLQMSVFGFVPSS
jgi:hypothetical protein